MNNSPQIIKDFKDKVFHYFKSETKWQDFLHTPDHFWSAGDHTKDLSPFEFLTKSRRTDKLEYAVNFVKEMNETFFGPSSK